MGQNRTGRLISIAISRDGQTNRSVPRRRTGFQPVVAGPASAHCNRGIGILRREPAQRDRSTQRSSRGTCSTRERAASSGGPRRHSAGTGIAISVKKGHPQDARERRGWDSNPRCPFRHAGFQDRCIQPLCHLSSECDSNPPATRLGSPAQPSDRFSSLSAREHGHRADRAVPTLLS